MAEASVAVAQVPAAKPTALPLANASVEAGSLHAQGKAHYDKREYAQAIELYTKAIRLSPAYADAWYDRALAHMGKVDFNLAAADFTKAIDLFAKTGVDKTGADKARADRQRAHAYINRARALTHLDKTIDALADFERARQVLPQSPKLLAHRAVTHWRAKTFDDALADASRALALDPNSQDGHLARGVRGLVHVERKNYTAAAAEFLQLIKATPDQRTAVGVLRTSMMLGRGNQPMTVRIVRQADSRCEPQCPEWIALQGVIERGTDAQFAQVIERLGDKRLPVLIDSPGGNVEAALAMGRKIREREFDVVAARTEFAAPCGSDAACTARLKGGYALGTASDIASLCSSSCVYVLAAGAHRHVGPMSLVGVHQIAFYRVYKEPPSEEQLRRDRLEGRVIVTTPTGPRLLGAVKDAAYVQTRTFYQDMGIDDTIMGFLLAAPTNGMHWFTAEQLVSTRLMTGTGFAGQFLDGKGITPPVVTLPAPKALAPASNTTELAETLGRELIRIGCLTSDDKASQTTIKRGLARYASLTGRNVGDGATQTALDAVRRHTGTVCPETCPRGTSERDGYCVKAPGSK